MVAGTLGGMVAHEEVLRRVYASFNARDVDAVLAALAPDVDWPNAWEGGRAVGHEAVREYWARQWAEINSRVEPTAFADRPDGTIAVDEAQRATSVATGELLFDGPVVHVYAFDDASGLVTRMD